MLRVAALGDTTGLACPLEPLQKDERVGLRTDVEV
jgi:hypothetical protein